MLPDDDVIFYRAWPGFGPGGPEFERKVLLRGGPPPHPFREPFPPPMGFRRRFQTRQERIAALEAYLRECVRSAVKVPWA